ncbi:MAG: glutamate--tRNA ligase [Patescibacteria group bacterium]|nr:glutamate--tRNA ligase [Patescibacteria group bacterium]
MSSAILEKGVRVRFAPSPTGHWHVGGVRTALFNWLFARSQGGSFILRVEDTDRERSSKEYEIEMIEMMRWLGFDWDEGPDGEWVEGKWQESSRGEYGPYHQNQRTEAYKKKLEGLIENGKAYYCYCAKEDLDAERQMLLSQGLPPKYGGHCRALHSAPQGKTAQVIRFKTPEIEIEFNDLIRGRVKFNAELFGDFVIAKRVGDPLYNFAVVVDDDAMHISHVIRGEEHLSNTPKQILIQRALNLKEPIYAHLPLILAKDRSKLSKRYAETSLLEYREKGFLPDALLNFLALLGWHPAGDREIFSIKDLVKEFDFSRIQKSGAIFDEEKLLWLNREHIRGLPEEELIEKISPFLVRKNLNPDRERLRAFVALEKNRIKTLAEFVDNAWFFFVLPEYSPSLLVWKNSSVQETKETLQKILESFEGLHNDLFNREDILNMLQPIIDENGKGNVLWPLRVALSGQETSPDPLDIAEALGAFETRHRVAEAIKKIITLT